LKKKLQNESHNNNKEIITTGTRIVARKIPREREREREGESSRKQTSACLCVTWLVPERQMERARGGVLPVVAQWSKSTVAKWEVVGSNLVAGSIY
jgi:hypothetical protein